MVRRGNRLFIYFSLFLALILMMMPLPKAWQWFRPDWMSLILIYWVLREPDKVGVLTAWNLGLIMDIVNGVLFGQYALAMSVVVYLTHRLRNRLRFFLFWQELFMVMILLGLGQLILNVIEWLIGHSTFSWWYWSKTLLSVLLWPLFTRMMQYNTPRMVR